MSKQQKQKQKSEARKAAPVAIASFLESVDFDTGRRLPEITIIYGEKGTTNPEYFVTYNMHRHM